MALTAQRSAPVRRQLTAYAESWKQDHDAAMRCRDVEEVVAVGVSTYALLHDREQSWRDRVFRGTDEYSAEDDAAQREGYRLWLATTEAILVRVVALEQQFGIVEGAPELSEHARAVRALLADWQVPSLSRAVGWRDMTLTPAAAAELERILKEAEANPPPMPGRRLETRDASFLKRSS
jgi:hypothetical protein